MAPIIEGPPEPGEAPRSLPARLAWFFALAIGSAMATALAAYVLKAALA